MDNKYIPVNMFMNFIEKNIDNMKYFYILSEENTPMAITLLKNKGIIVIPPMLTEKQMVNMIYQNILGESHSENNNVVVFLGADSKVGTSMISQCIAEKLSSDNDIKVLLAVLDGKPGMDYIHYNDNCVGIDTIKGKIAHQILSEEELENVCIKINRLYILQGTQTIVNRAHYHPEHIETFLELASQAFDIVIVDAGCNVELGMTIGALNSTQHRCLVSTQQSTCLKHFKLVRDQILSKLNIQDFVLIINKYMENNELPDKHELSRYYTAPIVAAVPYSEYGWQAEIEQCSLLNFHELFYKDAISHITSFIEETLKIKKEIKKEKKGSFF
ncbi:MAG: hypothetical protein MJA31_09785, partial [Clostridia bacterium]|nr:hypothetical protein [Clostridia bacterium]